MKNKFLKFIIICLSLFSIYFIFINNTLITKNIIFAVNLWITKVFPALFPIFIINELLINYKFHNIINNLLAKINTNNSYIYIFIMSMFSGAPTNALIIKNLVEHNSINSDEASFILSFTFFSNPIFLYNILSLSFNKITILKIIIIHYITNIFIILIFKSKLSNQKLEYDNHSTPAFSQSINNAIKKSLDTLIMILGTITFYVIISTIVINCFDFSQFTETIIKGFLEITQGLNNLSLLNTSTKLKEIIAISIISFGGISIHSQVQNVISNTNIKYKYFLIGRIFQTIFSIILIIIF